MLVLSTYKKILIEFDVKDAESIYNEYVIKKGYKLEDEWVTKNNTVKAVLYLWEKDGN